ncbi:UDP-N-acetylglucosamine transporter-like [Diaphorina citri]|uniref:UDP-N-acetylglucosamine transporter-like n=1 Tax=Diaphorina citri TaxID=121845 RepID=A0A3Q0IK87_DIACI|nr:UDP-N-acetylglucosamine transporter-like [Diaphorina citri]
MFTLQNNLFYMANTNLDSITYQITYQLKIITTALFSYLLLSKRFTKTQVFSLGVLLFGIVLIQIDESASESISRKSDNGNQLIGFGQVILASVSSGFTSVYLERIYKADGDDTLLIKNLQLSLLSIPISMINVLLQDSDTVSQHGLFFGYDGLVLTDVLFNALGGLIISLVLKHHDNITKIFSTSVSIVVTFVLSVFLFEKRFNEHFMIGMVHVFISIYLYYF